ncbi:MAG: HIT domain-containing protein [Pseudomonadota bacterium]
MSDAHPYDDQNIVAKIQRGEIPSTKVLETEHSYAFQDIYPKAPTHVLVIPKGPYVDAEHFGGAASDAEIADFMRAVATVSRDTGVAPGAGGGGFRLVSNAGADGVQEVPHFHVHVLGGRVLGRIVPKLED